MKKSGLTFILFVSIAISSYAQELSLGVIGGTSSIQSPDYYTKSITELGYGFGTSAMYGIKATVKAPKTPINLAWHALYTKFSGEESIGKFEQSLFTFGLGIEWNLPAPTDRIIPYLAFDIFVSKFGTLKGNYEEEDFEFPGSVKLGAGMGAGIRFPVLDRIQLEAGAKYNFNNIGGLSEDEDGLNTLNIFAGILYTIY